MGIDVARPVIAGGYNKDTTWTYAFGYGFRDPVIAVMRAKPVAHADVDDTGLADTISISVDILDAVDHV